MAVVPESTPVPAAVLPGVVVEEQLGGAPGSTAPSPSASHAGSMPVVTGPVWAGVFLDWVSVLASAPLFACFLCLPVTAVGVSPPVVAAAVDGSAGCGGTVTVGGGVVAGAGAWVALAAGGCWLGGGISTGSPRSMTLCFAGVLAA